MTQPLRSLSEVSHIFWKIIGPCRVSFCWFGLINCLYAQAGRRDSGWISWNPVFRTSYFENHQPATKRKISTRKNVIVSCRRSKTQKPLHLFCFLTLWKFLTALSTASTLKTHPCMYTQICCSIDVFPRKQLSSQISRNCLLRWGWVRWSKNSLLLIRIAISAHKTN